MFRNPKAAPRRPFERLSTRGRKAGRSQKQKTGGSMPSWNSPFGGPAVLVESGCRSQVALASGGRAVCQADRSLRAEREQQAVPKLVRSADQFAHVALQRFRRALEGLLIEVQNFSDFIHQETHRRVGRANHDVDEVCRIARLAEAEAVAQVDGRQDLAAEIDEAADDFGRQRHGRYRLRPDNFLYLVDGYAKVAFADIERAQLFVGGHGSDLHALGGNARRAVPFEGAEQRAHVEQFGEATLNNGGVEHSETSRR